MDVAGADGSRAVLPPWSVDGAPGTAGERLLRSVVDSLDGQMCILGRDGTILATNRLWDEHAERLGLLDVGVGASAFAAFRQLAPDAAQQLDRLVAGVLAGGQGNVSTKYRMVSDGRPSWSVTRVYPVRDHDEARAVVTIVDITEGMRTQEELRRITQEAQDLAGQLALEKSLLAGVLSSIPHLVYWKDRELRYQGVNEAFLTMRGLSDETEVTGLREAELPVMDALVAVLAAVEEGVLSTGIPIGPLDVSVPGPDGRPRTLLLNVLPHVNASYGLTGRPPGPPPPEAIIGVIGVAADVSHVSKLERQLSETYRLESIGQLAAGIAEELNTPVQSVVENTRFLSGSIEELLRAFEDVTRAVESPPGEDPGRLRETLVIALAGLDLQFLADELPAALTQSLDGLERVAHTVRAITEYSQASDRLTPTDINRAVRTTVELSRSLWRSVAEVVLELDPRVGPVRCYESELKQVLLSILVNAVQAIAGAGPAEPGRIVVRTERYADGVRISLTDDGPGMDENVRRRVFDPFFTTKEAARYTGQGLSLAYASIVGKHGGTLSVSSRPGQGATFVITLPGRSSG